MVSFSRYHHRCCYYYCHKLYRYKAKRSIITTQPAWDGQWEQRWCSSSSPAFREEACAQMDRFGGCFLLKQTGGRQYNISQSLRRERVDFPKGFTTGLQLKVPGTLCHMTIICHLSFHPLTGAKLSEQTHLSGCCFPSEVWASLLLHDNVLNPAQPLSSHSSYHLMGGLSQLGSMLG